ncbi:MAG TPA: crosslink repair DNA glycosylase YcaQ family protein, partial [Acidimicrobiia bacterium]|nr:crosslink repair DNA glycosylase YcaQ family protein [Acidimicrobiia bacterium]
GGSAWLLPDDLDPVRSPAPWVALMPSLDPTTMGWQQRAWYLGDHGPALFDGNGNAGPTVWADGRIVGGWAQRRTGEVVHRLVEGTGGETASTVAQAAAELEAWLGPMRITPRFPTPLQKELSG